MLVAATILILAVLGIAAQAARLGWRWRQGKSADVSILHGIGRLPHAYLNNVHNVMKREPRVARMHALVAGGTLASSLALMLGGTTQWWAFGLLATFFALLGTLGALIDIARRNSERPPRLSAGTFNRLPWALLFFNAGVALSGMGPWLGTLVIWPGAVLLAVAVVWLIWRAGSGPMRHAVAGVVHLIAHSRPERFAPGDPISSDLKAPSPYATAIGQSTDFGWNRLAMFDACIQCGKCETVCPAYAAGQPLNPKKLIDDLARGTGGLDSGYAGHDHPEAADIMPLDFLAQLLPAGSVAPSTLWSCTSCRACVEACPMLIEHVDAIIDLRRFETQERGSPPEGVTRTLLNLRETDTLSGRALSQRFDWAADLKLRQLGEADEAEVLLWVGDSAFDMRTQATLRALVRLLHKAEVDVAILGEEERDCGDLARRVGDEATFATLAQTNHATLARHKIGSIISADPHIVHCLSKEYTSVGKMPPVLHHSQILDRLVSEGRLEVPEQAYGRITYHDPCYLGRYLGETTAPRNLLLALGADLTEMRDYGRNSRCCGGGGGAPLADIPGKARIPDLRMEQANAIGVDMVAAACPYCTQMLEGVPGTKVLVRDIAELLWEAVEAGS